MAVAAHSSSLSFLALLPLLLIPPVVLSAAGVAAVSYETKSMDPGLVVMTLPEPVSGPESLAFDGRGGGPYSGVSDGRVLRWEGGLRGWTEYAYNSKHKNVAMCAPEKKLVVPESVCGRPLGLQFHRQSGDLYVADAYLGLLRVPARGGLAEVVAAEAGGEPFNFLNGLDVDQRTGDVYFTDSSTTYRRSFGFWNAGWHGRSKKEALSQNLDFWYDIQSHHIGSYLGVSNQKQIKCVRERI